MKNRYCKLNREFESCELWTNGLECPDCENCVNYRYLPAQLNVGDVIQFVGGSIKCTNRYGGKFTKPVITSGKILGSGFTKTEYNVKRLEYPFTAELLHRNQIIKVLESK